MTIPAAERKKMIMDKASDHAALSTEIAERTPLPVLCKHALERLKADDKEYGTLVEQNLWLDEYEVLVDVTDTRMNEAYADELVEYYEDLDEVEFTDMLDGQLVHMMLDAGMVTVVITFDGLPEKEEVETEYGSKPFSRLEVKRRFDEALEDPEAFLRYVEVERQHDIEAALSEMEDYDEEEGYGIEIVEHYDTESMVDDLYDEIDDLDRYMQNQFYIDIEERGFVGYSLYPH